MVHRASAGGVLGVLMMIPLRRYLIVKEHGELTYPEGTACAEVLIAGEERGAQAALVFRVSSPVLLFKLAHLVLKLWDECPGRHPGLLQAATAVRCDISPELLGVGYIIGYRSSAIMVGGRPLVLAGADPGHRSLRRRAHDRSLSRDHAHLRHGPRRHLERTTSATSARERWPRAASSTWLEGPAHHRRLLRAPRSATCGRLRAAKPTEPPAHRARHPDHGGPGRRRCSWSSFMTFLPQIQVVPGLGLGLLSALADHPVRVLLLAWSRRGSRASSAARRTRSAGWPSPPSWGPACIFSLLGWTGHAYDGGRPLHRGIVCIAVEQRGHHEPGPEDELPGGRRPPGSSRSPSSSASLTSVFVIGWTVLFAQPQLHAGPGRAYDVRCST